MTPRWAAKACHPGWINAPHDPAPRRARLPASSRPLREPALQLLPLPWHQGDQHGEVGAGWLALAASDPAADEQAPDRGAGGIQPQGLAALLRGLVPGSGLRQ